MALYQQNWFIKTVTWLNDHSPFWKKYIWGKSANIEDFCRNPAEVFRDTFFPFIIKDVKPISLINCRFGYIFYDKDRVEEYYKEVSQYVMDLTPVKGTFWQVPMGDNGFTCSIRKWTWLDIRFWNPWWTKFANAFFMFQLAVSFKWFIPIPYISFVIRYSEIAYFQFGIGYGPQLRGYLDSTPPEEMIYDTVLTIKARFGGYIKELQWNPGSEVFGFYEGTV